MARNTKDWKNGKHMGHPGWGIIAAVVAAIGILFLVQGFVTQLTLQGAWDMGSMWWILGYYFIGVIFVGGAKMLKWKAMMMK